MQYDWTGGGAPTSNLTVPFLFIVAVLTIKKWLDKYDIRK